jgi:hypothetical protein
MGSEQRRGSMKRMAFIALTLGLCLMTVVALAGGSRTRLGVNFSGTRNPQGCYIAPDAQHPKQLDAKCTKSVGASGPAAVRYRFLKNVGGLRKHATISADITTWVGDDCVAEWMVRRFHEHARTLRITIPYGSYCDIRSVSWSQP